MAVPDWATYRDRMHRVWTYIYDHLDEDLDLEKLAEVACMSPYHWHRVYRALQGETIAQTVQRLRLQRAAHRLIHSELTVEAVARENGYPNRESFSRAFQKAYGLAPGEYREKGGHTLYRLSRTEGNEKMYEVTIKPCEAQTLANVPHKGAYMEIGKAFEVLAGAAGAQGLFAAGPVTMVGVFLDDPGVVAEADLRSMAGMVVSDDTELAAPLEKTTLAGGEHAVLLHKGPYAELKSAYDFLYGVWLENSGRVPADAPSFEVYLNSPMDTAPTELLTEIHLPLQG